MKIKKDMMVKVVSGNFKGMTGKVLKVIPTSQRAIVEGVALTKRAVRPTQENPQGGFSERERSLHISNLMALEGDDASRTGIDQKCGTIIVGGRTGAFSGFMMQRGRMIVLGNAGKNLGPVSSKRSL